MDSDAAAPHRPKERAHPAPKHPAGPGPLDQDRWTRTGFCCDGGSSSVTMDTTSSIKMTTLAIQNLFLYVEEENLAALKLHLDRFKEVDGVRAGARQLQRTSNGQTPLMVAAEQGSLEVVQELREGPSLSQA
ncbi:kinase D-interacting substrate of 220 kDa B-like [Pseudoliparis swirei]|uniref:kinase D-interacting substrate of 220 kDa B-like n=1 Tax=Pseudoliparis swirei TaxID=2059687 RepID=UPI0024BD6E22|nr:kinase D-interacting substrate of 220 kDa B-like [Pseudoliparis swirei]